MRLIGADGEQIGVIPTRKALELAKEKKLDLVVVAPTAKPPVCKIIDYGKYKYETMKRAKEAKKKQNIITVKEIRMSPNIDTHDLEVKAKRAAQFLNSGDRVKVSIRFRGREMDHTDIGRAVMERFVALTDGTGVVDKKPIMEGRHMIMFMSPNSEQ